MLCVDPKKRITFEELFVHPINSLLEQIVIQELRKVMAQENGTKLFLFYLNHNSNVEGVYDINKNNQLNKATD